MKKLFNKTNSNNQNLIIKTNNTNKSSLIGSYRMFILIMLMLHFFCTTSLRMNLGMAIVCMVNSTAVNELISNFTDKYSFL